jgi:formylglycine-generating enzyme required for sulfatase activity
MRSSLPSPRANELPTIPGCTGCQICGEDAVTTSYRARRGDEEVMIDMLRAGSVTDPVRQRLRRSSGTIRSLDVPQILPCIDLDVVAGRTYLVYPWPGEESLAQSCVPGSPADPTRAIDIMTEVARGLEAAHALNLVHGGLVPRRIHLGSQGVRIGGLGLALGQAPAQVAATDVCLAPELVLGTGIDLRADVHAAGVLLWRLSLGAWPWRVASPADLDAWARSERPEVVGNLPPHLDVVLRKAVARQRDERYANAQELREDLERIAHGFAPLHARPATVRLRQAGAVTVHRLRVPGPPPPLVETPVPPAPVREPRRTWSLILVIAVITAVTAIMLLVVSMPAPSTLPGTALPPPAAPEVSHPSWARAGGSDAAGTWAEAVVGGIPFRLRRIPAGTAGLGSPATEAGRSVDETPTQVVLTKPFWLAETELTQELYRAAVGTNPSRQVGATLPVENVTWDEAQAACARIAALVPGLRARLPSEAEWEYACRAGTTGPYALAQRGWDDSTSGGRAQPVAGLPANPWGLFDLHGNVLEWTADAYAPYPTALVADHRVPDGVQRVARGGSWAMGPLAARSAARFRFMPRAHLAWLGLRLAADD